ncbi:MAG: hypothetical protein WCL21_09855 [Mariniphaga sp.]
MSDFSESIDCAAVEAVVLSDDTIYPLPDLAYLNEMAGGDESFMKEIISLFLETAPALILLMKQSALAGDMEKLHFSAHKLLPQLTFVGILTAIPDIQRIESGSSSLEEILDCMDKAIAIINFSIEDLKKMI